MQMRSSDFFSARKPRGHNHLRRFHGPMSILCPRRQGRWARVRSVVAKTRGDVASVKVPGLPVPCENASANHAFVPPGATWCHFSAPKHGPAALCDCLAATPQRAHGRRLPRRQRQPRAASFRAEIRTQTASDSPAVVTGYYPARTSHRWRLSSTNLVSCSVSSRPAIPV